MATPTSAIRSVEAAITTLLMADSSFATLCPGGVDSVELQNQLYPFVLIDNGHEQPWNTMGGRTAGNGRELLVRLHVFSRYKGDREALLILERLVELLDFATLSVSGYGTVIVESMASRVLIEDRLKLEVRHIPAEFLVRVHE